MPASVPAAAPAPAGLFHCRARVVSVSDGDTCTVDIDLGLGVWVRGEKVRLHRINAPELTGREKPKGVLAREQRFEWEYVYGAVAVVHGQA